MAFCRHCGTEIEASSRFCSHCGTEIMAPAAPTADDAARAAFVGRRYAKYRKKWDEMRDNDATASWNWSAFLFGVLWMSYRKMYILAAWMLLAILVESLAETTFDVPDHFQWVSGLVFGAITGTYGNYWYRRHTDASMRAVFDLRLSEQETIARLARHGGTSVLACVAAAALVIGTVMAVSATN